MKEDPKAIWDDLPAEKRVDEAYLHQVFGDLENRARAVHRLLDRIRTAKCAAAIPWQDRYLPCGNGTAPGERFCRAHGGKPVWFRSLPEPAPVIGVSWTIAPQPRKVPGRQELPSRNEQANGRRVSRALTRAVKKLKRIGHAKLIRRDDLRLGFLLSSIKSKGDTLLDIADSLLKHADNFSTSHRLVRKLRELRSRIETLSRIPLEDELLDLAGTLRSSRARAIALRRLGWDGRGGCTLEVAGTEFGITRERVRQICDGVVRPVEQKAPFAPALDRVLKFISQRIPGSADEIESDLALRGLTRGPFRIEGVESAAMLLGRRLPFAIARLNGKRYVLLPGTADLVNLITQTARRDVEHWGAATIEDVIAKVLGETGLANPDLVERILSGQEDFQWLDQAGGWFWLRSVARNRILNQIRKILSVAGKINISELRGGVGRHHRLRGFAPPRRVLLELCRQTPGYRVEGDVVLADPPLDWRRVLAEVEAAMAEVLLKHGSVMQREELEKKCLALGMNRTTFYIYLDNSPIIIKYARGVYGLRGARVPPGVVERLIPKVRWRRVLLDYGRTADGRIWFGYQLSRAMIASGTVHVPTAMRRFVDGEFALKSEDGARIGTLTPKESGAWGLSPLFRRRGGEPGDFLVIVVDPKSREAVVSLGDAGLIDAFQVLGDDERATGVARTSR